MNKFKIIIVCLGCLLACSPLTARGQDDPGPREGRGPDARGRDGRGPDSRGRDGRGPPIPPEQRLLDQVSVLMTSDPAEWSVLSPKIKAIQVLLQQRERFSKPKPPPPPRPPRRADEPAPPEPPPPEQDPNLIVDMKVDAKKDAPAGTINYTVNMLYSRLVALASYPQIDQAQIQTTLAEFRDARIKSDEELAKARAELRQLVTGRQELILVVMGILD